MKKLFFLLIMIQSALSIFAQTYPRLMNNPSNQTPVPGQSLYAFTVRMRSERSVVLAIDDVKIGHFFNGETAEIAIPNGRHVVKAYQMKWDARSNSWKNDDDDRLTNSLNGERLSVDISDGPKLNDRRTTKLSFSGSVADTSVQSAQITSRSGAVPITGSPLKPGIEGAVARASVVFIGELPSNSTIAVISISSDDPNATAFSIDELEYQLVTSKRFKIVDRKTLDTIRAEQKFQLSGDVSDRSAVSIGHMLGANYVITGSISGMGSTQRITLKALDVKTAQIVAMAREAF